VEERRGAGFGERRWLLDGDAHVNQARRISEALAMRASSGNLNVQLNGKFEST
jgi:hypothetical protein